MYAKLNEQNQVAKYPYTVRDLRADHPRTSFPRPLTTAVLAEYGVVEVQPAPRPATDYTQVAVEGVPVFTDGAWHQAWAVEPVPNIAAAKQTETQRIKQRAYDDIVAQYPEWKQRNMIADALEKIVNKLEAAGAQFDKADLQEAIAAWTFVKQRRAQSDTEEAALDNK